MEKSEVFTKLAVILPSYEPDAKFLRVVDELVCAGFKNIIIVDDGSGEKYQPLFDKADEYPQTCVLHHGVNKGKGRALKTAFCCAMEKYSELDGVITIDGDGQHLTKDIISCGCKMLELKNTVVLGSRDFDVEGVPPRSVAGNKFTSALLRILFGIKINDTQTGLRAIPSAYLSRFGDIEGERFEYETNMLLYMKRWKIDFFEQPITTVYDPEDYSSHYNAFKDSLRISKILIKYIAKRRV